LARVQNSRHINQAKKRDLPIIKDAARNTKISLRLFLLSRTHYIIFIGSHWQNKLTKGIDEGEQGCQIFLGIPYQNGENIPNDH
jgi:hypothetical protein